MDALHIDRERFEQLLELAQAYRGWNRKQLAAGLGRDPSNLTPASGVPKLDLVLRLAEALEWPVEDVVGCLCSMHEPVARQRRDQPFDDFELLDAKAKAEHMDGRYADMLATARRAYDVAASDEDRAKACNRAAGGLEGIGRYSAAIEMLLCGLGQPDISLDRVLLLRANLAIMRYTQWQLDDAIAAVTMIVKSCQAASSRSIQIRLAKAIALFVRGHSHRRKIWTNDQPCLDTARCALEDLHTGERLCLELAEEYENPSYLGIASTCHAGATEVEVLLGNRDADSALAEFTQRLDTVIDLNGSACGDLLESCGWCCIFAANIVLRHLTDPREQQHLMALFTNKADEIAHRLDNWAIRERIVAMEFARRKQLGEWTGVETPWTLDAEDLRVIAGTMGRFPTFQATGWKILESAAIVRGR